MEQDNFIMSYSVDKTFESDKFLKIRCRVCHDGESPNKTYFTKETMAAANKESLEYIPILAHVYIDENGMPVMGSHDMHLEQDKLNNGETRVIYDETPIGMIPSTEDNNCTIEEYEGLNYTYVDAYIWRDYANYAEQLVENAGQYKMSMEIDFPTDSLAYDAANERYDISAYRYRAITLLNESLGTGMKNAKVTTTNFSEATMSKLAAELKQCLNAYNFEQKGVEKDMNINELLEKYGLTLDELDFSIEGLSEEEIDAALNNFACKKKRKNELDVLCEQYNVGVEEIDFDYEYITYEELEKKFQDLCASKYVEISFRISHEDIRCAVQKLLNAMNDEAHYYVVDSVYDKYFYYTDWFSGDSFKQSYKMRKDIVSLDGDAEPVYHEFVTQSEKDELESMRQNYAALLEFKRNTEKESLQRQKNEIFSRVVYESIVSNEEFKQLVADSEQYTVEECENKADIIYAKHFQRVSHDTMGKIGINYQTTAEYAPYGSILPPITKNVK